MRSSFLFERQESKMTKHQVGQLLASKLEKRKPLKIMKKYYSLKMFELIMVGG